MEKLKIYNRKNCISFFRGITAPFLFSSDKMEEIEKGIFIYNENMDDYLRSKGAALCATLVVTFLNGESRNLIIYDSWFKKIPDYAQKTIIQHEIGHIKNGDIINLSETKSRKIIVLRTLGILDKSEIKADEYSASVVGVASAVKTMIFMIRKTNFPLSTKIEFFRRSRKLLRNKNTARA